MQNSVKFVHNLNFSGNNAYQVLRGICASKKGLEPLVLKNERSLCLSINVIPVK